MTCKKSLFVLAFVLIFAVASLSALDLGTDLTYCGYVEYDENGWKIHSVDFGAEYYWEYYPDGKIKSVFGIDYEWEEESESSYEYDSKGRLIREDLGYEVYTYVYDDKNFTGQQKYKDGALGWKYDYDSNWRQIHAKRGVMEWWKEFDSKGNLIYWKNTDAPDRRYEYDSNGNRVKEIQGEYVTTYEYDSAGRLIHETTNYGDESIYEYSFWENGNVKERREYMVLSAFPVG